MKNNCFFALAFSIVSCSLISCKKDPTPLPDETVPISVYEFIQVPYGDSFVSKEVLSPNNRVVSHDQPGQSINIGDYFLLAAPGKWDSFRWDWYIFETLLMGTSTLVPNQWRSDTAFYRISVNQLLPYNCIFNGRRSVTGRTDSINALGKIIVTRTRGSSTQGSYRGVHVDAPTDTFNVTIDSTMMLGEAIYALHGLPQTCGVPLNSLSMADCAFGILHSTTTTAGCKGIRGIGRLRGTALDTLRVDYEMFVNDNDPQRTKRVFVGKRL